MLPDTQSITRMLEQFLQTHCHAYSLCTFSSSLSHIGHAKESPQNWPSGILGIRCRCFKGSLVKILGDIDVTDSATSCDCATARAFGPALLKIEGPRVLGAVEPELVISVFNRPEVL